MLFANREILIETVVRFMHDLVQCKGGRETVGMRLVMRREFLLDARQPFVQQRRWPRIQRRKGSDDARLALGNHQFGHGNNEQRRTDHGNRQTTFEQGWHGHSEIPSLLNEAVMRARKNATRKMQGLAAPKQLRCGYASRPCGPEANRNPLCRKTFLLAQRARDIIVGSAVARFAVTTR